MSPLLALPPPHPVITMVSHSSAGAQQLGLLEQRAGRHTEAEQLYKAAVSAAKVGSMVHLAASNNLAAMLGSRDVFECNRRYEI